MCRRLPNGTVAIDRSTNLGDCDDYSLPSPVGAKCDGQFTSLPSQFIDGIVTCHFTLSNLTSLTSNQVRVLNPLSQSGIYHPIWAVVLLRC